jgi:hypothetical protein
VATFGSSLTDRLTTLRVPADAKQESRAVRNKSAAPGRCLHPRDNGLNTLRDRERVSRPRWTLCGCGGVGMLPPPPANMTRIHLVSTLEVNYWCQALNCSETRLRNAVLAVGPLVADVWAYFNR